MHTSIVTALSPEMSTHHCKACCCWEQVLPCCQKVRVDSGTWKLRFGGWFYPQWFSVSLPLVWLQNSNKEAEARQTTGAKPSFMPKSQPQCCPSFYSRQSKQCSYRHSGICMPKLLLTCITQYQVAACCSVAAQCEVGAAPVYDLFAC